MSIAESLKKIVTKLGGTSKAKTIEGLLGEIAENSNGSGGSSGGVLIINYTRDQDNQIGSLDVPFNEIYEAFEAGKPCRVVFETNGLGRVVTVVSTVAWNIDESGKVGDIGLVDVLFTDQETFGSFIVYEYDGYPGRNESGQTS